MSRNRIEIYWKRANTAPEGVIAQVRVTDGSGSDYLLPYPCKLTTGGWVNAASSKPLAVCVTYWKLYVQTPKRKKPGVPSQQPILPPPITIPWPSSGSKQIAANCAGWPAETAHGDNSVPPAVCCRALAATSPDRQQSCIGSASVACFDNPGSAVHHAFHPLPHGGSKEVQCRGI
jgi:hypothetical protein